MLAYRPLQNDVVSLTNNFTTWYKHYPSLTPIHNKSTPSLPPNYPLCSLKISLLPPGRWSASQKLIRRVGYARWKFHGWGGLTMLEDKDRYMPMGTCCQGFSGFVRCKRRGANQYNLTFIKVVGWNLEAGTGVGVYLQSELFRPFHGIFQDRLGWVIVTMDGVG
eukprot:759825-Hanusia_phi.AAC.10